jgi:hypothetical protein
MSPRCVGLIYFLLALLLQTVSAKAQKRIEAGVFLDYLKISQTGTDNVGVGGRIGYRIHRNVMLEGELAYDYGINFNEAFLNVVTGNLVAIERTSVGVTHFLAGPEVERSRGHFHPFATLKAGAFDFRLSPSLLPISGVVSDLIDLRTSTLNAALYPAGGLEVTLGPAGLRLEMGDEVYFNHGPRNNFRLTFGPTLRF